jgi:hypothetical protein
MRDIAGIPVLSHDLNSAAESLKIGPKKPVPSTLTRNTNRQAQSRQAKLRPRRGRVCCVMLLPQRAY